MNDNCYYIKRLILLNSGPMEKGIFPMDQVLSIAGENNNGKTSVINALQFILMAGKKISEMDFGSHLSDETKKYYFPYEWSYVLTEMRLPTGDYVVGAVGNGALKNYSHELFVYRGEFRREHYKENSVWANRQELFRNIQSDSPGAHPTTVSSKELHQLIRGDKVGNKPILKAFTLRNNSSHSSFNNILSNLLHMKKVSNIDMKKILLDVFQLNTRSSNSFADLFDKTKNEVHSYRKEMQEMGTLEVQGPELIRFYQMKKTALLNVSKCVNNIKNYGPKVLEDLDKSDATIRLELTALAKKEAEVKALIKQKEVSKTSKSEELGVLRKDEQRQGELTTKYPMAVIDQTYELQTKIDEKDSNIKDADKTEVVKLESALDTLNKNKKSLEIKLDDIGSNVIAVLQEKFQQDSLEDFARIYNNEILHIHQNSIKDLSLLEKEVRETLGKISNNHYKGMGLDIDLGDIRQVSLNNPLHIQESIVDLGKKILNKENILRVCRERDEVEKEIRQLTKQLNENKIALFEYHELQNLLTNQENRSKNITELDTLVVQLISEVESLRNDLTASKSKQSKLEEKLNNNKDTRQEWQALLDTVDYSNTHDTPIDSELSEEKLSEILEAYPSLKREYKDCSDSFDTKLTLFISCSSKASALVNHENHEETCKSISEFIHNLEQAKEMRLKQTKQAFINLTSSLNRLTENTDTLVKEMRKFNKKVNSYKVSDLSRIDLEVETDKPSLKIIRKFIEDAHTLTGDSLFEKSSSEILKSFEDLADTLSSRKEKMTLIDLFELKFIIEKPHQQAKEYRHLDSIQSNGTTITLKAIINMHLMNYLLDETQERLNIPYYIDEAADLDERNQKSLVKASSSLGFTPILAAVQIQPAAHYCVYIPEKTAATGIVLDYEEDQGGFLTISEAKIHLESSYV